MKYNYRNEDTFIEFVFAAEEMLNIYWESNFYLLVEEYARLLSHTISKFNLTTQEIEKYDLKMFAPRTKEDVVNIYNWHYHILKALIVREGFIESRAEVFIIRVGNDILLVYSRNGKYSVECVDGVEDAYRAIKRYLTINNIENFVTYSTDDEFLYALSEKGLNIRYGSLE